MSSYASLDENEPPQAPADGAEAGDSAPDVELPSLETLVEWHNDWEEATLQAREDMQRDLDYHDGKQWSAEEQQELDDRGQPIITINLIARKVNFLLGEEIRKRSDPLALPRTPAHEDGARALTDSLRYVRDDQKYKRKRSKAAKDIFVPGVAGMVVELEDESYGKCVKIRRVAWDRLCWDPRASEDDFSDGRFRGVFLWLDIEDARAMYSADGAAGVIESAIGAEGDNGDTSDDKPRQWYNSKRKRLKVCEFYFQVGDDFYVAHFTKSGFLAVPEKTFLMDESRKHSVCPLSMMVCYRDSENSPYGVVRNLISPQDEVNHRRSKALFALTVHQVIAEKDAIPDPQKFQAELNKPDGMPEVAHGAFKDKKFEIGTAPDVGPAHLEFYRESKGEIDATGPSSSTIPELPAGASGRAIQARRQSASQEMETVFDNLRALDESVDHLVYLCVRQGWTEEKWLRVTDDQELNGYRFVALNRKMTRAARLDDLLKKGAPIQSAMGSAAGDKALTVMREVQQAIAARVQGQQPDPALVQEATMALIKRHPVMQEQITDNQVDAIDVDIVLSEAPDTDIIEQEEFESLSKISPSIMQARPDLVPDITRMLIQASQLRSKRELLKAMDKGPDPKAAQMQQQMQQLQTQLQQAQLVLEQAQALKAQAEAQKAAAEAQVIGPKAAAEVELKHAQAVHQTVGAGLQVGAGGR